ncbi:tRNA (adenosine(37)-N6)-threonylcarbamoyltransferase complex ATPase subunit type 1 TsaE [Mycoplasma anserisalpingitidis]|uniref:tRNA threonylcarbamoyladenosine biosynthesis protein TsaE n=1 Tax=Mycoplasma anserisalpingitidis TaxID=519450 RepID=A0A5B8K484_9MOLU|nr:tRNA (adenosine(37)-N6)-threonylcarbamoyltransferase complex ATPase subunit type 1 TsaE [Mycoplasma anserisalpingitidis]QDY88558.1 tRNA (adenosine(37)-N6)-threonylcarbamoyltransferase complex ATPase subunit type 1 TsaE [Mycoplasma anserisalpingitidis]
MLIGQNLTVKSQAELANLAKKILEIKPKVKFVLLSGDLGAGKTTFVKYLATELGISQNITSPTFNYMKNYDGLIHIDAYNLSGDLDEFEDFFEDNIIAIEWFENLSVNFENALIINIKIIDQNTREIKIERI